MSLIVFSQTWANALQSTINANETYAKAGASWEDALLLVASRSKKPDASNARGVFLDLAKGKCRAARPVEPKDFADAPYIILGTMDSWQLVLDGKIAPLPAIMRGKLKLVKGSIATLLRYVNASKALVSAAQQVDFEIPAAYFEEY